MRRQNRSKPRASLRQPADKSLSVRYAEIVQLRKAIREFQPDYSIAARKASMPKDNR